MITTYKVQAGDLTEAQLEVVCNHHFNSGVRASKPELYASISISFYDGDCFAVSFENNK